MATALTSRVSVLLIANGAAVLKPEEVPLGVSKLTRINALPIAEESFASDVETILLEIDKLTASKRRGFLPRVMSRQSKAVPIVGTWVSSAAGDALLRYSFHADGTYEFVGGLRQERASGSMLFETYHAGEFSLTSRALRLTAFRSSTSRRDPDFPGDDYIDRPERVKNSEFNWELTDKEQGGILILTDTDRQKIRYTCILK